MKTILHKADSRGHFDHGWLKTYHTFSFADYYDPERVHFGALRVINDDRVEPGTGFGTHSHSNMEIISVPLEGTLEHRDSMGNVTRLKPGEIQVMSAGTGIMHSEYSVSVNTTTEFLQIWILPEQQNVKPRYFEGKINKQIVTNAISEIVYPYPGKEAAEANDGFWIHQQAWISFARLTKDALVTYDLHTPESYGVYLFVIEGNVNAAEQTLEKRDGLGIIDVEKFDIKAIEDSYVLLIEVPPFFRR